MTFIEQIAPYVQKFGPMYDIMVNSPVIAQAVLESANGTSELAGITILGLNIELGDVLWLFLLPMLKKDLNKDQTVLTMYLQCIGSNFRIFLVA